MIPIALPLSEGGNTDVAMAMPVAKIIALPIPCMILNRISIGALTAKADRREENVNTTIPMTYIFFRPKISLAFPNGTRKTAAERIYDVASQASRTASIWNSF